MDGFANIASGMGLVAIMCASVLPSLADAFVQNFGETVRRRAHGTGCDATGQENQFRCVQYGKQGTDHVPLTRCGACKTSRYCSKALLEIRDIDQISSALNFKNGGPRLQRIEWNKIKKIQIPCILGKLACFP